MSKIGRRIGIQRLGKLRSRGARVAQNLPGLTNIFVCGRLCQFISFIRMAPLCACCLGFLRDGSHFGNTETTLLKSKCRGASRESNHLDPRSLGEEQSESKPAVGQPRKHVLTTLGLKKLLTNETKLCRLLLICTSLCASLRESVLVAGSDISNLAGRMPLGHSQRPEGPQPSEEEGSGLRRWSPFWSLLFVFGAGLLSWAVIAFVVIFLVG